MFGSVAQRYLKPFARLRDSWPNRRDPDPSLEALRAGSWKSSECSELDEIVLMVGPDERRGRVRGRFGALHGARIATEPAGDGGRETWLIHSLMRPWWGPECSRPARGRSRMTISFHSSRTIGGANREFV